MSKIYVDEIRPKTSGSQVLMPEKPAFRAYTSSDTSLTGGSASVVQFDTEDFDIGSNYNSSTGVFTAPISGLYSFSFNLSYYLNGDSRQIEGRLRVNGTVVQTADSFIQQTSGSNTHTTVGLTTILNLTANDTVDVQHVSVGTLNFYSNLKRTSFSGYLIG